LNKLLIYGTIFIPHYEKYINLLEEIWRPVNSAAGFSHKNLENNIHVNILYILFPSHWDMKVGKIRLFPLRAIEV